ncbi:hypothetical protein RHSIM_Rhsim09G0166800 [Rhododendron simsii]|uniref:Uncharacterized protein n=1 Tax=Rhododendron simsii TaxID=118357 RepID=A0A834GFB1_RHOSS|nr:hypothetical protein RHSIM_Rhsim09G0166800 [Rhododendron simsii]
MASEAQPNTGAAVKLGLRKPVIFKVNSLKHGTYGHMLPLSFVYKGRFRFALLCIYIEGFGGAGDGGCLEEAKLDGWRWGDDDSVWPF